MKIVMMGSYPVYHFAEELGIDPKVMQRITSWNQTLADALARSGKVQVHVITSTRAIKKTKTVEKHNLKITYLVIPRGADLITGFQYTKLIVYKILKRIQPDLIHGIGTEHMWPYIAVGSRYPSVITVHGIMSEIIRKCKTPPLSTKRIFAFLEKKVFGKCKNFISINPYMEKSLKEHTKADTYAVENPVPEEFFSLNIKPSTNQDILFIGDISPIKDTITLIRAFSKINSSDKSLNIVGKIMDRKYYLEVLKCIEECSVKDRVHFKGFLLPKELREEYQGAAMLVLSSVQETAPMCIAEAMASGLPVVSTDTGGVSFMVEHEKTGFLVKMGDSEKLASYIDKLLEKPYLRDEMGRKGKDVAEARWRPEMIAERTIEAYKSILEKYRNAAT